MESVDPSDLDGLPRPGAILSGKYRIERVLGAGGMGAVFSATHLSLGQPVAIKFLRGASALDPAVVERFSREAWAASRIQSDHVARVTDVASTESGAPFLVMEHLKGEDLESLLSRGPLAVEVAVGYVLQACEALAEAHQLGIVHRDLKPSNLFLTHRADGSPWIKVLDFGISKISGAAKLTATAALMGSPLYMSPEHLNASPVDERADIWGIGVILYELLTGDPPFVGESLPQICVQILNAEPRPIRRPDMPAGLEAVVRRCLAKKAEDRYPDLARLALALGPFGGDDANASVRFVSNVFGRGSLASMPTVETELAPGSLGIADYAKTTPVGGTSPLEAQARSSGAAKIGSSTDVPVSSMSRPLRRRRQGLVGLVAGLVLSLTAAAALFIGLSDTEAPPESIPVAEQGGPTEGARPTSGQPQVGLGSVSTAEPSTKTPSSAAVAQSASPAAASAVASATTPPPKTALPKPPIKSPPPPTVKPPSTGKAVSGDTKWSPFDDR